MKRSLLLIPLALPAALVYFLGNGPQRGPDDRAPASVGNPAPVFHLDLLHAPQADFSPDTMRGQVWLLNAWASWCGPCRDELPALNALAGHAPIVGLNYKDKREKGLDWLRLFGNPYQFSAHDAEGRVGADYGIHSLPETFVIDKQGVVRLRHAGPVTPEVVRERLLPLIDELNRG